MLENANNNLIKMNSHLLTYLILIYTSIKQNNRYFIRFIEEILFDGDIKVKREFVYSPFYVINGAGNLKMINTKLKIHQKANYNCRTLLNSDLYKLNAK